MSNEVLDGDGDLTEAGPRSADLGDEGPGHGGGIGWTTPKVLGVVAAVVFVSVLLALTLRSRFDGEAADSVDVGFLRDMTIHHEQAIQIGLIAADNAAEEDIQHFGQEAVIAQQYEIGYMRAILEDWGYPPPERSEPAMEWMGMVADPARMPGMASQEQMAEYARMEGSDVDRAFIELMSEHHRGGLEMADLAREQANDPRIRELAERMARNQRYELFEYEQRAEALGLDDRDTDG